MLTQSEGYNDIDTITGEDKPIALHIKTKEYHFGNAYIDKVVRLVGLIFKQPIGLDEINADVRINMGYQHYLVNTVNITESLVWGRDWGLLWGFRQAVVKMIELTMRSNTFQIEFFNNELNSPISIIAIGFVFEPIDFHTPTLLKDEVLLQ